MEIIFTWPSTNRQDGEIGLGTVRSFEGRGKRAVMFHFYLLIFLLPNEFSDNSHSSYSNECSMGTFFQ